ncbi:MAG: DUF6776 family protein [Halioglobus sp.]
MALLLAIILGAVLGRWFTGAGFFGDDQTPRQLRETLEQAQLDADNARQELAALQTRSEVDRQSLEIVRREMVAQKQQITSLEEDLRFYRSLMSPESAPGQVQVREPEIVRIGDGGRFDYRIVIHQEAVKHQLIRGDLVARVEGKLGTDTVTHVFAGKDVAGDAEWPPVKFRYFQEFTGTFALPEGFEPVKVFVTVKVTKPRKLEAREEFAWRI